MSNQRDRRRSSPEEGRKQAVVSPAEDTRRAAESAILERLEHELKDKLDELTRTNRQLKRKIFDLYTIFEISRNINAVLNYETLLDTFIFTCLGQVGALKGGVFLQREVNGDKFYPVKCKGSGDLPTNDQYFAAGSDLVQYLTRLNRPVATSEVMADIAGDSDREILKCFDPGIVVPLIFQTRLTGIFTMSEKLSGRDFRLDDLEFLSILGNQIAVAIENARLFEAEKLASQQLRSTQEQLLLTERLAAVGEMSAKVAHEVNNPLGIIKNYLLLLRRSTEEGTEPAHHVSVVSEEIDRIARIVRQMLDFHRPVVQEREPVKVTAILNSVLSLVDRQLGSGDIAVIREYGDRIPDIPAAPEGLKQVFLNLIINARDAMPSGGKLIIRAEANQDVVRIEFLDTGPGIPAEVIPRIFEPFFTTKDSQQGSGLGLSVCYGIIRSHGGSITFKNHDTGGCFTVELPVMESESADDNPD